MLVLSRQRDEIIRIGDDVRVTIVDIRGDKVRLGIDAPPQVPVHREEVYQNIQHEVARTVAKHDDYIAALLRDFGKLTYPPASFVSWMGMANEPYVHCLVAWALFKERRRAISKEEVLSRIGRPA